MDILNPNQEFLKYMPEILDAFVEVYNKKNEKLLRENEKKIIYTNYINPESALKYYNFLKDCKVIELAIKYLKKIDVLDSHYELKKSYQKLPKRINNLLRKYLDDTLKSSTFKGNKKHNHGICSFNELVIPEGEQLLADYHLKTRISEQIKYLNNLRNNKKPEITEENYDEFKTTKEYKKISKKIKNYLAVFEELNSELSDYLNDINYLKEYYNEEKEKENKNYKLKMLYTYERIIDSIPKNIRQKLEERFPKIEERVDFLLGFDLNEESLIEYYSSKYSENLENPNISLREKKIIKTARILFLKNLGANVNCSPQNYEELVKKEEIKNLIPSESLVDFIITLKEDVRYITKRESIRNNKYFKKSVKNILKATIKSENLSGFMYTAEENLIKDNLFSIILKKHNCCFPVKAKISSIHQNVPVLFLLITENENAVLDYVFLHELTHALEFNEHFPDGKTGFDILDSSLENPYNKKYRLYERLNETLTDIITEKIRKILFKKGIYIAENKKKTDIKIMKNRNTDNLLKIILYPLMNKVEQELLDSRLTGKIDDFIHLIGINNFRDLNDIINKVDYLIEKENLKKKLKNKNYKNPTVIEYYNQLARAKIIYSDIDNHLLEQNNDKNIKEYKKLL